MNYSGQGSGQSFRGVMGTDHEFHGRAVKALGDGAEEIEAGNRTLEVLRNDWHVLAQQDARV